jgi:hypothetical protein
MQALIEVIAPRRVISTCPRSTRRCARRGQALHYRQCHGYENGEELPPRLAQVQSLPSDRSSNSHEEARANLFGPRRRRLNHLERQLLDAARISVKSDTSELVIHPRSTATAFG